MSEKIARIELNRFAAFEDLSLEFSPGVNLIIGANGTGKTQILKFIYSFTSFHKIKDINEPVIDTDSNSNIYAQRRLTQVFGIDSRSINMLYKNYKPTTLLGSFYEAFILTFNKSILIKFVDYIEHNNLNPQDVESESDLSTNNKVKSKPPSLGEGIALFALLLLIAAAAKNFKSEDKFINRDDISQINLEDKWFKQNFVSTFIPAKEIISNARGFLSTYNRREIDIDITYADILESAYLPKLREQLAPELIQICNEIEEIIGGKVVIEGEKFFVESEFLKLPMIMVAEGHRKLALLYVLIQNGEISKDSIILWDEPEANLNPKLQQEIVKIILALARLGAQVFIATHSYFLLKEFDLETTEKDDIKYITLYRDKDEHNKIKATSTNEYSKIENNPIDEVGMDQLDRKFQRARVKFDDANNA
ncbi:MAG: AAA family ATPase [Candidatus Symbiobacter sp.]|nr:AAA family ATPase [Candidatus Symbiobacter sp.]